MGEHKNVHAALLATQGALPRIGKDRTAKVATKSGRDYGYSYVDLATITAAVFPILEENGLVWTCPPTLDDQGRFVLRYHLRHVASETEISGDYPLGTGTSQELGSSISYSRRYALCAVLGIVPEDDDGLSASQRQGSTRRKPTKGTKLNSAAEPSSAETDDKPSRAHGHRPAREPVRLRVA